MACVNRTFMIPTQGTAAPTSSSSAPARGQDVKNIKALQLRGRHSRHRRRRQIASASITSPADATNLRPLPQTVSEQVVQCADVIRLAASPEGGSHRRQRVELLLPINQRRNEFTLTDGDDYGDNNDAVYKAAMETASAVIRLVDPNGGDMSAKRVDTDNDPVGVLMNAAGTVRALIIPFAQNLDDLRALAEVADKSGTLTLLFNPQWNEAGQVVSDFGIGPWRKRSMDFLDTFEGTYSLTELRVGAASTRDPAAGGDYMGTGGVARVLKAHGGRWQVFAMGGDGSSECIRVEAEEPTYEYLKTVFVKPEYSLKQRRRGAGPSLEKRLEAAAAARVEAAAADVGDDGDDSERFAANTVAGATSVDIAGARGGEAGKAVEDVFVAAAFGRKKKGGSFDWAIASTAEISAAVRAKALTPDDCSQLDKSGLRSALSALGLPTSGKLEAMRTRLQGALLAADADNTDW